MSERRMAAQHAAGPQMSLVEHLEELRWRIVKSAVAILVGAIVAFIFREHILEWLSQPYERALPDAEPLKVLSVTEPFNIAMRLSLFGGFVLASPVVFYQLWAFINPALTPRERRWAIPIVFAFVLFFVSGVAFGYWLLPTGLEFLLGIQPGLEELIRASDYISLVVRILIAFGLVFEFPLFLFAAAAAGLITSDQLARARRWAVLVIVVVAAAITPQGDPLTLTALSVPLYVFYEATIWVVRLVLRR